MHVSRYLLLAGCLLALTGCMQTPRPLPVLSPQVRSTYLNQMQAWQFTGRAAISNANQGYNLSMEWQQRQQKYQLDFWGPLAAGSAQIIGEPGKVSLTTSDGQSFTDTDPEKLIFEHLGWDLPLHGLVYWIKGQAAPNSAPTLKKFDRYNQLQTLEQDGWHIDYQSYVAYDEFSLPEKLTISQGNVKLRIKINEWSTSNF